ncbi:hypothetical protein NRX90_005160, partial [Escherichia coli]|nr:hypothetical protein [Escherichia coli]
MAMTQGTKAGLVLKGVKVAGMWLSGLIAMMILALLVADTGMRHTQEVEALRLWLHETRFGWLG